MSIMTQKCKIFSGKNHTKMPKEFLNRTDTAVVFPQQPCDEDKGKPIPHTYFRVKLALLILEQILLYTYTCMHINGNL